MTTTTAATTTTSSASTQASANTADLNSGLNSLASNYQSFLTLLTTQLQNQDPLSPEDTNQFTSQLTQMTGVEQQLLSNQLLQQLVTANQSSGLSNAVGLIGKTATASGSSATLTSGTASWPYTLATPAAAGTVSVVDSGGTVVWTGPLTSLNAGSSTFAWNGKDSGGNQQTNGGTYTLKITATDASGRPRHGDQRRQRPGHGRPASQRRDHGDHQRRPGAAQHSDRCQCHKHELIPVPTSDRLGAITALPNPISASR